MGACSVSTERPGPPSLPPSLHTSIPPSIPPFLRQQPLLLLLGLLLKSVPFHPLRRREEGGILLPLGRKGGREGGIRRM
jgi:hypothetical protein